MEIDTGADFSLISKETVSSSFMKNLPLDPTDVRLCTYTREAVPVLGKLMVSVVKDEASLTLPLLVVKGVGTTLLGRDWLQQLRLDWKTIFSLHSTLNLQQVLDCHNSVFTNELGTFNKSKVKFDLKENSKPFFLKRDKFHLPCEIELLQSLTDYKQLVLLHQPNFTVCNTHSSYCRKGWLYTSLWRFQTNSQQTC